MASGGTGFCFWVVWAVWVVWVAWTAWTASARAVIKMSSVYFYIFYEMSVILYFRTYIAIILLTQL